MADGFFAGLFGAASDNSVSDRKIKGTVKRIDKAVAKLGKLDAEGAQEHLDALREHRDTLVKEQADFKASPKSEVHRKYLRDAHAEAGAAVGEAESHVKAAGRFKWGQRIGKVATSKPAMIIGGAALAGAALIGMSNARDRRERESKVDAREQQTAAMRADIAALQAGPMVGADTLMGAAKIEGEHAMRIKNARGGGLSVSSNPVNPEVSLPYDVVQSR